MFLAEVWFFHLVVWETPYFLAVWKIPCVYGVQTSMFLFEISCEILVARSSAKFEYFLKSMHDYHFVQVSLSSEMALIIQGQYEHCFQYMARYHIYLVVSD